METTLIIPRLLGTRNVTAQLVRNGVALNTNTVILDFTDTTSVAQGACDEIIKNLIELNVKNVRLVDASERAKGHLQVAVQLRDTSLTIL